MTSYAYYPGCSGLGTSIEYEKSTRAVFKALNIQLVDIPDWSCCGSTPAHATSHLLSAALCARNLEQARSTKKSAITTSCPSCLANLRTTHHRLQNEEFRGRVNELLEEPCKAPQNDLPKGQELHAKPEGLPNACSTLQVLVEEFGLESIKKRIKKSLGGIKIIPYYGCLMSRPAEIMQFDNPEQPMAMDDLLSTLGGEVLPFPLKTECCGAAMGIPRKDITARLSGKLLAYAHDVKADVIVVACPLCHMNLDLRQKQAAKAVKRSFNMPIVYFTQLLGLCLDLPIDSLGFDKLVVSPKALLKKIEEGAKEASLKEAEEAKA